MLPYKYDPKNADHVRIKEGIEVGNSLPTLTTPENVLHALQTAGFTVVQSFDANRNMHNGLEVPWYQSLKGSWNFRDFRMTYPGRLCTHVLVTCLEIMRIAPSGSTKVSELLNARLWIWWRVVKNRFLLLRFSLKLSSLNKRCY